MRGPRELFEHEDHWATRMGKWFPGERTVFRGRDLHRAFASRQWMELYVYSITGRDFTPNQIELLNSMWVYTSYPDPRLWNNRVAALAGTARSTGALGLSAALAVSEATIYGERPAIRAIDFLYRLRAAVDRGAPLAEAVDSELRQFRTLPGYGRPVVRVDERIPHLISRARRLRLSGGSYTELAFQVDEYLMETRLRLRMNYAALTAALCADLGFSTREFYLFAFGTFLAGAIPCWIDALQHGEGDFLPIRSRNIRYEGPSKRRWSSV